MSHNNNVNKGDRVYHLGDLTMAKEGVIEKLSKIIRRLNGVHELILGNHDKLPPFDYIEEVGFSAVHTSLIIKDGQQEFLLAHDPSIWTVVTDPHTIFLCGHIHKLFQSIPERKVVNVGVDVWNFTPVNISNIMAAIAGERK